MAKINKTIDLGSGMVLQIAINEGIATMIGTYGKEMIKIYYKAKETGKKVKYDYRRNAMIEYFDGPTEEYLKKLELDYETAKQKQKEGTKWANEKTKK